MNVVFPSSIFSSPKDANFTQQSGTKTSSPETGEWKISLQYIQEQNL